MLNDGNHAYEPAPDGKERKGVENDKNFERLLDSDEAAGLLRMHPRTLRTKARIGSIPGVHVGKRWRFRASTLNRWLENSAAEQTAS
jgi:excisionase family DNA binding protein